MIIHKYFSVLPITYNIYKILLFLLLFSVQVLLFLVQEITILSVFENLVPFYFLKQNIQEIKVIRNKIYSTGH